MTPPANIEAACVGCAVYESPARGQHVCPGLKRQIEEAEAEQRAARLRSMVVAEAPGGPHGLIELVCQEAVWRQRAPLALSPAPSTSSVSSSEGEEVACVEVSRAVR